MLSVVSTKPTKAPTVIRCRRVVAQRAPKAVMVDAAAENGEIRALPLLEQDDQDQEEAENDVNAVQHVEHGGPRGAVRRRRKTK